MTSPALGIVIVSYGHATEVQRLLDSLVPQLTKKDRLVIVDNKKPYTLARTITLQAGEIVEHDNGGFGAGCNFGASKILDEVDTLLFLNPDTFIQDQEDYLDIMRTGSEEYDAWQSLLLLPDGTINSAGNVYHVTGLSWTAKYGEVVQEVRSHNVSILSGACFAIKKSMWRRIGGFTEEYFMYMEDVDLSLKVRRAGGKLGILPEAKIFHDYDYAKGKVKWLYIERNRLLCMAVNWPTGLLAVTLIPNVLFNALIFVKYLAQGMPITKLKADMLFIRSLPTAHRLRRQRSAMHGESGQKFLAHVSYRLDSPLLGVLANRKVVNGIFWIYYRSLRLLFG